MFIYERTLNITNILCHGFKVWEYHFINKIINSLLFLRLTCRTCLLLPLTLVILLLTSYLLHLIFACMLVICCKKSCQITYESSKFNYLANSWQVLVRPKFSCLKRNWYSTFKWFYTTLQLKFSFGLIKYRRLCFKHSYRI